jgi:hypothetical protein
MSRIAIVVLIYHPHKHVDNINLLGSLQRRSVFPVMYGQTYKIESSFKQETGRWIISIKVIVISLYHRHKPVDLIALSLGRAQGYEVPLEL